VFLIKIKLGGVYQAGGALLNKKTKEKAALPMVRERLSCEL
jgi:hypothetical protein